MMRLIAPRIFMLIMFLAGGACIPHAVAAADEMRFGSVAMDIPVEMHRRLTPLTKYLGLELGKPVSLKLSPNMPAAISEVASGAVELAYLTPVAYIRSHAQGDTQIVVKTATNGRASFQLMIIVRKDSPITTVAQLAGKNFAFGDKAALLQRAVVVGAGMPLDSLGEYHFIGHYDNIVRGVMKRDFDAGIVKDTTAFKWQDKGVRVLHASPHLPPYNITASRNVDARTLEKLKHAFLKLDMSDAAHADVIRALDKRYTGFAPTSDDEYDTVRQLVRPFDKP